MSSLPYQQKKVQCTVLPEHLTMVSNFCRRNTHKPVCAVLFSSNPFDEASVSMVCQSVSMVCQYRDMTKLKGQHCIKGKYI